ncbi:MAG: TetR/AcrR family transcriptional regulator [Acidimicrobiaceae bacterium]|nr:TetR/AcrR family transcriptional regulator [Acidimicrobiaceae bacterium]
MTRTPRSEGADAAIIVRPLRRDAEVNLSRILAAARDEFAEQGYEASMERIAARAEVGVGTLYRRFPNKADLFNAVVVAAQERSREIAETVLADVPPEEAVFEFVRRCIAAPSCWRATIAAPPWHTTGSGLPEISPLLHEILERSQRAGTVRADIEVSDIVVTLLSVRSIADVCDSKSSKPSIRFLELVLDGLRPGQARVAHPPLSVTQLDRILRHTNER